MPDDIEDLFAEPPDALDEDFSDAVEPFATDCPKCGNVDYDMVDEEPCSEGQLMECTNCRWIWRVPL